MNVVNIDEYNTSKNCFKCGNATLKSRTVKCTDGREFPSHGVLRCSKCFRTYGRDLNGAKNMLHLVHNYLHDLDRPDWLSRN